jgi:hypothetical protein
MGSKKGSKFGEFVSSRDLHIEAQALTNMVEDFPSRTAWCVVIPMEKPLLGKRVIRIEIIEAKESVDSK